MGAFTRPPNLCYYILLEKVTINIRNIFIFYYAKEVNSMKEKYLIELDNYHRAGFIITGTVIGLGCLMLIPGCIKVIKDGIKGVREA